MTKTRNSITSREVILADENRSIYGISKRVLDPRRPVGVLSPADKDEGLVVYKGHIDFVPVDTLSYGLEIAGVREIVSSASALESTSLVFCFGLDLFFARRAPSKEFDLLSPDFSRVGLMSTMFALGVAIVVSRRMVEAKKIRDAWA